MSRENADEVRIFWAAVEAEVGERVLLHAMGQAFPSGSGRPDWGLFYLTASYLCFQSFPRKDLLESLFSWTRSPRPDPRPTRVIRRSLLSRIEVLGRLPWWRVILAPRPPVVVVSYNNEGGAAAEFRFSLTDRQEEFVDALRL